MNQDHFPRRLRRCIVLIDTWWNVNTNKLGAGVEEVSVLIDTWWNVNKSWRSCEIVNQLVLIDTWWNVNRITAKKKRARTYTF